ncbi:MAG: hypothetical protein QW304_06380 [Thermoproteota archaeon]
MVQPRETGNIIDVWVYDPQDNELFYIELWKTGGINMLRSRGVEVAERAAGFIWMDDWEQTWGTVVDEPTIEERDTYTKITCYSQTKTHLVSLVTEVTVTKFGFVFIRLTMRAPSGGAPNIRTTGWVVKLKTEEYSGKNIYINYLWGTEELNLPSTFINQDVTQIIKPPPNWVDLSVNEGGVTLMNLNPEANLAFIVQDGRGWDELKFIVTFWHGGWGQGAMLENEERVTEMALFFHGTGGYEPYTNIVERVLEVYQQYGGYTVEVENAIREVLGLPTVTPSPTPIPTSTPTPKPTPTPTPTPVFGEVLFDFETDTQGWDVDPNVGQGALTSAMWTVEKAYHGAGCLKTYFDASNGAAGGVCVYFAEGNLADFQDKLLSVWVWVPQDAKAQIFMQSATWDWKNSAAINLAGGSWTQVTWDLGGEDITWENAVRKLGVQIGQWNVAAWSGDLYIDYFTTSAPTVTPTPTPTSTPTSTPTPTPTSTPTPTPAPTPMQYAIIGLLLIVVMMIVGIIYKNKRKK